jgi:hypothetical protein
MRDDPFFEQIAHAEVAWGDRSIWVPVFYYDAAVLGAAFLTPLAQVRAALPSPRMKPLRMTPWHALTTFSVYEYRDCDIGPYNEVSINIPVTIDKPAPVLTGVLRPPASGAMGYILHLPVTTEIAWAAGVEFAGYPKVLAGIEIERKDGWVHGHWSDAGSHVLSLSVRQLPERAIERSRVHALTVREGRILRSELMLSERQAGASRDPSDVVLRLGDHPVSQELRELRLGRPISCFYVPSFRAILSPPLESYPAG